MRNKRYELLACENARLGCRVLHTARDLPKHRQYCLYQFTACDICGTRLLLRDLVTHQKVKRCHEKKISRERIEHAKLVHCQMVTHFRQLHGATAGRHVAYRKFFKDIVHKKIGWTAPVPPAWTDSEKRALTPKLMHSQSLSPKQQLQLGLDLGRLAELNPKEGQQQPDKQIPLLSDRGQLYQHALNEDEFMYVPEQRAPPASARTPNEGPSICARCNKVFRTRANHGMACRWHRGVSCAEMLAS